MVTWVQIPKGEGIMVRKWTGRVQFLVLFRLWTGPPQINNNNNNLTFVDLATQESC